MYKIVTRDEFKRIGCDLTTQNDDEWVETAYFEGRREFMPLDVNGDEILKKVNIQSQIENRFGQQYNVYLISASEVILDRDLGKSVYVFETSDGHFIVTDTIFKTVFDLCETQINENHYLIIRETIVEYNADGRIKYPNEYGHMWLYDCNSRKILNDDKLMMISKPDKNGVFVVKDEVGGIHNMELVNNKLCCTSEERVNYLDASLAVENNLYAIRKGGKWCIVDREDKPVNDKTYNSLLDLHKDAVCYYNT